MNHEATAQRSYVVDRRLKHIYGPGLCKSGSDNDETRDNLNQAFSGSRSNSSAS